MAHQQRPHEGLRELALFAGAGGGILGGHLLGWRTVCAVELDCYAAAVLIQRQNDGILPPFPIWDNVRTFDGRPWRGIVDVVSGGFPCTDISAAGKGAGIEGEQSGLWREMARIIGEVRPRFAFVENSPMLTCRGIGRVLGDLAEMGFDAEWGVVSAADAIWLDGDPCLYHERERIWIVASNADTWSVKGVERYDAEMQRRWKKKTEQIGLGRGDTDRNGRSQVEHKNEVAAKVTRIVRSAMQRGATGRQSNWWSAEPDMGRVAHGVANRVDRLRTIGNGQIPAVAAIAWKLLSK